MAADADVVHLRSTGSSWWEAHGRRVERPVEVLIGSPLIRRGASTARARTPRISRPGRPVVASEHLSLKGLMAVAPLGQDPAAAFARLAQIRAEFVASYPTATWLGRDERRSGGRDPGRRDTRACRLCGPRFEGSSRVAFQEMEGRSVRSVRGRQAVMSAMRKIGEYLGLLEDTGRYDDEYDDQDSYGADSRYADRYDGAARTEEQALVPASRRRLRTADVADLSERRRPAPSGHVELSRITTLHPRTYNEARVIGENFRDGTPVIMNLSEMDDSDAKRLVDFAAGLVFATRGSIERITSKVFLLSPPNVTVAAEDKARLAETDGFFNQS